MKKLIFFIAVLFPLLHSCNKDSGEAYFDDHALMIYERPDTMALEFIYIPLGDDNPVSIGKSMPGEYDISVFDLRVMGRKWMEFPQESIDRGVYTIYGSERFDSLAVAHGDNIKTRWSDGYYYPTQTHAGKLNLLYRPSLYRRLGSLDIMADRDYDAVHPARTPLNDIAQVTFYCIDEIADGDLKGISTIDLRNREVEHVEKLTDFNAAKRKFVGYHFRIKLTSPPAIKETFNFTITYRNEDGDLLSQSAGPVTILP